MRLRSLQWLVPLVGIAAVGCTSSDTVTPPAANQPPVVTGLATTQSFNQDTTATLSFNIRDDFAMAGQLSVTAAAPDGAILPPSAIVLGGAGADRTIMLMPTTNAIGSTDLTVRVSDPEGMTTTRVVRVEVRPVNASVLMLTNDTFALEREGMPVAVNGMTYVQDANDPAAFDALLGPPDP